MGLSTAQNLPCQGPKVGDILRHDDAPLVLCGDEYGSVVQPTKLRPPGDRLHIMAAGTKLLRDAWWPHLVQE